MRHPSPAARIQLDDLKTDALDRLRDVAFLTLQASPGNRQAWVAVSGLASGEETKEFARRLRKGVGADQSASGAPPAKKGDDADRSVADFFWCMMAAQRGWSIEETANKLLHVSAKAQERARLHDEGYAMITSQNAAAMRGRQAGRE